MSANAKITALPGVLPSWSFADRLRKARREYTTFTQPEMADALGVGLKAYSAWEAGKNKHPQDIATIASKLNELTGIPRTWFLGWEEENPHPNDSGGGFTEPPAGLEPATCGLQGRPLNPIIDMFTKKAAA